MNTQDVVIISPNMIKIFEDCPFKFYFRYKEKIPTPSLDKNSVVGKNIHALASYYLKGVDVQKFEDALSSKEKEFWDILKIKPYFQYEVVGTEKSVSAKIGDFWVGGRMDAIVKNEENYYILDYKTGGVRDDMIFDAQTVIYLLLADSLINEYGSLSFIYLDLKNNKEVKIEFSQELKKLYLDKLTDMCNKINCFNPLQYERNGDCKCEYSKICKLY